MKDLEKLSNNVKIEQQPSFRTANVGSSSYSSFGSTGYTSSRIDPNPNPNPNPNNMTFTAHSSDDLINTLPPIKLPHITSSTTSKEGYYTYGGVRYSKQTPIHVTRPMQHESLEFRERSSVKVCRKKNSKAKKEKNKKLQRKKQQRRKK